MNPPLAKTLLGLFCMLWGVGGVIALLFRAVWRISQIALEPISDGSLTQWHWLLLVIWSLFMAYSEGYRGFHKAFSPRVVSRAIHLGHNPTILRILFAPLICMGLGYATRKRLTVSWCLLIGLICLVLAVQTLPQPWRGMIDAGVVIGLALGMSSLFWFAGLALLGRSPEVDPEVPAARASA